MSKEYTTLATSHVTPDESIAEYVHLPPIVHLDDPATDAMFDFQIVQPLFFDASSHMFEARRAMEKNELHIVLVSDEQYQLVGLLSLEQILSGQTISLIEESRVERKEVLIRQVMTPLTKVEAIDLAKLKHAKVGHVIATLQKLQAFYLVVYETNLNNDKKMIRGVFLASHISKLLGKPLKIDPSEAKSVAELSKSLHK